MNYQGEGHREGTVSPPGTGVTRLRVMKRSHGSADSGRKDYKQESDHGSQRVL